MNLHLTFNQKIAIALVVLGALTTGSTAADMATLIGPGYTKLVTATANIAQTMLAGFLAVVTGQSNLVRDVQAMPGVDKIVVNECASDALATLAVDPTNEKIEAKPSAVKAVTATAKAAE